MVAQTSKALDEIEQLDDVTERHPLAQPLIIGFFQIKMPITQIWPWGTFASFTNSQLLNQMITAFVGLNGQLDQVMKQFWLPFDLVFKVGEITSTVIRLSVTFDSRAMTES